VDDKSASCDFAPAAARATLDVPRRA